MSDEGTNPTPTTEGARLLRDTALGNAIQYHIRDVIRAAAGTVTLLDPKGGSSSGMRESQLRNVVNAALSAQSVEEVAAFILYQMGRSTNRLQWQFNGFGDRVVKELLSGPVLQAAQGAIAMAARQIGDVATDERDALLREAHIALARQYLGYLNRLFYFAEKSTERADQETSQGRWGELTLLSAEELAR